MNVLPYVIALSLANVNCDLSSTPRLFSHLTYRVYHLLTRLLNNCALVGNIELCLVLILNHKLFFCERIKE